MSRHRKCDGEVDAFCWNGDERQAEAPTWVRELIRIGWVIIYHDPQTGRLFNR